MAELASRVKALAAGTADPALLADVDIYRKAAEYILRFPEEFATKAFIANTLAVLDTGLARAPASSRPARRPGRSERATWFAPTSRASTAASSRTA